MSSSAVVAYTLSALQLVLAAVIWRLGSGGITTFGLLAVLLLSGFMLYRVGIREASNARDLLDAVETEEASRLGTARRTAQGTVAAGIAHEINTPLGALKSNLDVTSRALARLRTILEDDVVDETEIDEVRRIVRVIDGVQPSNDLAIERMEGVVHGMRAVAGPDGPEIGRVDLNELLENTLTLAAHRLDDGIEIRREYGDIPLVECRPNQIGQVLMNLVVNAAQAISDGGSITLRTESDDREVCVRVEDTGSGIEPDHLARIFEAGFTTKGGRMGMGMGLLITEEIVRRHGGRIEVDSTLGEGTAFAVTLPIVAQ